MRADQAACTLCPLFEGATRQLLDGTGPDDARVMLVGEAPGEQEDATGIPFVGAAGAKLNDLLAKAGLRREQVRITNAIRCRPPGNRKPTAKEVNACRVHLEREVAAVQPQLIVALGNEALRSLAGVSGIKKYRGAEQVLRKSFERAIPVMPTYHPAFVLPGREPGREGEIVQDLITGLRLVDGGFTEIPAPYWIYRADAPGPLALDHTAPLWSFDIETNARPIYDPLFAIRFVGVYDGSAVGMFVGADVAIAAAALAEHLARGGAAVGHNASGFDRTAVLERFGLNVKCHDTQLLAHLIDEEQSLRLQDLCVRHLGVAPWKDDFDAAFWERGPQTDEEWTRALTYNARDCVYDFLLFGKLWELATPAERNLYERHNLPCSRALAATERHGVYVSEANVQRAIAEIEVDQRVALLTLKDLTRPDFNPGSHQQVRELLFDDAMLGLPAPKKIRGSEDASTDVEALKKLLAMGLGERVVRPVLDYRENSKLLQYLRKFEEAARSSPFPPWVWPSYSMSATTTGRTTAYDFPIQTMPRDLRVRSSVGAPPGYVLLEGDASQLQLRIAAEFAGPQSALYQEYLKPNPDVHLTMAARLTGKAREHVTDAERSNAKPPNFAFLFLADEPTYMRIALEDYDKVVPFEEATLAKRAFREWGLDPWYASVERELQDTGQVVSIFGRKRRLPNYKARDKYTRLEALRQGVNFADQSVETDMTLLWLTDLVGQGYFTTGFIHDAIHVLVPDDPQVIAQAAAAIRYSFEVTVPTLIEQLVGYRFAIPLVAEVKVGPWWGYKPPKVSPAFVQQTEHTHELLSGPTRPPILGYPDAFSSGQTGATYAPEERLGWSAS